MYHDALETSQKALRLTDKSAKGHRALQAKLLLRSARAAFQLGDIERARTSSEAALSIDSELKPALSLLESISCSQYLPAEDAQARKRISHPPQYRPLPKAHLEQ
jgi:hypothetical protein